MKQENEMIPLEEAKTEVGKAVRRIALLHLAFAETIVKEMGDDAGKALIVKAIRNYGIKIGGKAREEALAKGLPLTPETYESVPGEGLPAFGTHSSIEVSGEGDETVFKCKGCEWAKTWKEHDGDELGRLYCLVDPAQYMAFNPDVKFVHLKAEPDGDDGCEIVFRKTNAQEREDFSKDRDWSYMDYDQV